MSRDFIYVIMVIFFTILSISLFIYGISNVDPEKDRFDRCISRVKSLLDADLISNLRAEEIIKDECFLGGEK